jgi:deazaflavin-dependent oxidoreductase (nitroreductase family)
VEEQPERGREHNHPHGDDDGQPAQTRLRPGTGLNRVVGWDQRRPLAHGPGPDHENDLCRDRNPGDLADLVTSDGLVYAGAAVAKKFRLTGGRKAFNSFLKGLIQVGIPTGRTVLLTVPGGKTGLPRSTPITLLVEGGRRFVISPYGQVGWVQNVRAAGRARLKSRGREETVRLQELKPGDAAPLLKKYLVAYRFVAPFFDAKAGDPIERFAAEGDRHPVFEVLAG